MQQPDKAKRLRVVGFVGLHGVFSLLTCGYVELSVKHPKPQRP